jgi:hypothetical protein
MEIPSSSHKLSPARSYSLKKSPRNRIIARKKQVLDKFILSILYFFRCRSVNCFSCNDAGVF